MIRRVAFEKAGLAGVCGALGWEVVMRTLLWLDVPLFDIVRLLGTLVWGEEDVWKWWITGMLLHAGVGAIWAVFYAYFFWSAFEWPPVAQGIIFSLLPAILAGVVMIPQIGYMHPLVLQGMEPSPGLFASRMGWGGPVGDFLGHGIYGAILGSLYQRPVGLAARRRAGKDERVYVRHGDRVQLSDD
jgi:hypothetical protein